MIAVPATCPSGVTPPESVSYEELNPTEKKFLDDWMRGMCTFVAAGDASEQRRCISRMTAQRDNLAHIPRTWRCKMAKLVGTPGTNGYSFRYSMSNGKIPVPEVYEEFGEEGEPENGTANSRKTWYYGQAEKEGVFEVFRSRKKPTPGTHEWQYGAVVGPFESLQEAQRAATDALRRTEFYHSVRVRGSSGNPAGNSRMTDGKCARVSRAEFRKGYVDAYYPGLTGYGYQAEMLTEDEGREAMEKIMSGVAWIEQCSDLSAPILHMRDGRTLYAQDTSDFPQPTSESIEEEEPENGTDHRRRSRRRRMIQSSDGGRFSGGLVDKIIAYEGGELDDEQALGLFSELVKGGLAWQLQGCYGRQAARLIRAGYLDQKGNILEHPG